MKIIIETSDFVTTDDVEKETVYELGIEVSREPTGEGEPDAVRLEIPNVGSCLISLEEAKMMSQALEGFCGAKPPTGIGLYQ